MVGLDEYDRKARLAPGLLAIAPVVVLVITLGLRKYPAVATAGALIGGAGATYLLAILVRHLGSALQPGLWSDWGGRHTTRLIRLREPSLNPVERDRWRAALEGLTGVHLLDIQAEAADPSLADQTIETAVGQVLYLGQRHKDYRVVYAENIQYGFERNLWGVRWVGRVAALACCATLIGILLVGTVQVGGSKVSSGAVIAGLVIDGAWFLGWLILPSKKRARLASERYARQLFTAVVNESRSAAAAGGSPAAS